jgi:hypothetical protein
MRKERRAAGAAGTTAERVVWGELATGFVWTAGRLGAREVIVESPDISWGIRDPCFLPNATAVPTGRGTTTVSAVLPERPFG